MNLIGYVTLLEADEYVTTHFVSTDTLRTSWESLTDADRAVLLLKSFEAMEMLPFTGCKSERGQIAAFPRFPLKIVPEAVKSAQVENAIALSDGDAVEDAGFYEKLWQFGVESYGIGNLSESTSNGNWGHGSQKLVSVQAVKLLQPYLNGGYCIE